MLFFLLNLISLIFILLGIAFFTLLERKILSLTQVRLGPNKISLAGILQPVMDGIKLILKEMFSPQKVSKKLFLMIPLILFFLMIQFWVMMSKFSNFFLLKWSFLGILIIFGLSVYFIVFSGCFSSSKFGMVGSLRASSQSVSYEITLVVILFSPLLFISSLNLEDMVFLETLSVTIFIFPLWWICCVAEMNRAPFDLAEGESELISGFNLEFGSLGFIFIFLSEYGMILCLSFVSSTLFFNFSFPFFIFLFCLVIIYRSSFPRIRYDMLMKTCWMQLFPCSSIILLLFMFLK